MMMEMFYLRSREERRQRVNTSRKESKMDAQMKLRGLIA